MKNGSVNGSCSYGFHSGDGPASSSDGSAAANDAAGQAPESRHLSRRELLAAAALPAALGGAPAGGARGRPEIWDLHCHLEGFEGGTPRDKMDAMVRFADRLGVDRLCVFMGYPFEYDPAPDLMRRQNDQVLEAIAKYPRRAFGFVYLNPKYPEESLREFDRCVRDGPMVGVKLWVAKRASAPELDAIIEHAAAEHAVIFQHTWFKVTGNLPGESTPLDLAALARRHPSVPMICGHSGADWERGIAAVRELKNVYLDLAGSDPTAGFVEMAVREAGAARVIYGSDVGGRSFGSQLGKVMGADIPEADRRLILAGNLKRMMEPILRAKGVQY